MKAIVQSSYGAPEEVLELSEIEAPVPRDDEVLVRVRATSVNTPDWAAVTGEPYLLRGLSGLRRPKRPVRGTDVSGLVEAVGCAVTEFGLGDSVFGAGLLDARIGTFAELTAVPAHRLALKPAALSFEDAAACVMSGLTALDAVRVADVGPGTRMLINGAAGGVGTFALQMAKRLGAEVTGVCSTRNLGFLRELGADHVVDYTREEFIADDARYDVVLDNVLNHSPSRTIRVLAPKGILVPNSLGNSGGWFSALPRMAHAALLGFLRTDVRWARCPVTRENLEELANLIVDGLRVVIDRAVCLEDAAAAVAHMLGHHARGNLVLSVAPSSHESPSRVPRTSSGGEHSVRCMDRAPGDSGELLVCRADSGAPRVHRAEAHESEERK